MVSVEVLVIRTFLNGSCIFFYGLLPMMIVHQYSFQLKINMNVYIMYVSNRLNDANKTIEKRSITLRVDSSITEV